MSNISTRIQNLRKLMKKNSIDFYLVNTGDYHSSEYINDYFKTREYISGFTGSSGTVVISQDSAALWTDGRYYVQAENQLEGTGIVLYKDGMDGVPKVSDYLYEQMPTGSTLGFDGRILDAGVGIKLAKKLRQKDIVFVPDVDLVGDIWEDRPQINYGMAHFLPDGLSGNTVIEKLDRLRADMKKFNCGGYFLSKLDDIAWLFNIRGNDIRYNPVCFAYSFITLDRAVLFLNATAINQELVEAMKNSGVEIFDYQRVEGFVRYTLFTPNNGIGKLMYDEMAVSYNFHCMFLSYANIFSAQNPVTRYKSVKNAVELDNIRKVYLTDSIILTRFLYFLKTHPDIGSLDEYSAGTILDDMRLKTSGCMDLSFDTISAYGENAAMMHYSADKDKSAKLDSKGLYLVDSGGQYIGGTTDVTRTISLGELSSEEREDFTITVMSMLRLADVKFLHGCSGINLDIIARQLFWEKGQDYKCGTGHGIGYMLNVHEGPQRLASRHTGPLEPTVFEPGMIISDEPGAYKQGRYGIRIENILEVVEREKTEDGRFLGFEHLTFVPIDLDAIDMDLMTARDKKLLNNYHRVVYDKLSVHFEGAELEWLKDATREVNV